MMINIEFRLMSRQIILEVYDTTIIPRVGDYIIARKKHEERYIVQEVIWSYYPDLVHSDIEDPLVTVIVIPKVD